MPSTPRSAYLRCVVLILASILLSTSARSQTAEFTEGSPGSNTMTLQVPLGSYPGRGMSLPINLNYSSKVWRLGFIGRIYYTSGGSNQLAEGIYSEYGTAGWTTSLDVPVVEWPRQNDVYWYSGKPYTLGTFYPYTFRVARVFIHMPDGSTHELRKADQVYQDNGLIDTTGTFYAVDGSRMRYDGSSVASTGTLYLADGTRYVINSSSVQCIDRNGNTLAFDRSARQWTDTMGRVIGMPWPANPQADIPYPYALPAVNGGTTTYTLKFKLLSAALSPGTPALKPVGDFYLPYPDQPPGNYNSNNFTQPTQGASMFASGLSDPDGLDYQTNTRVIGRGQVLSNAFNPVVLAEVVLPNGLSYKFSYNNFGELDKVTYPAGAYQRYEYGVVPGLTQQTVPYPQVTRGMTSRWLSANGSGSDEVRWLYGFDGGWSVTAPGPTGNADGIKTVTSLYTGGSTQNNFGYDSALIGLPYEERFYASPGGAMLRRTLTSWATSDGTYNRPPQGTGTYTATRNPRPTKTVSLILDTGGNALTSSTTSQYDTTYQFTVGADRTQSAEYAFSTVDQTTAQTGAIASIPPGALVRSSETTFLTSDSNYRTQNVLGLVSSSVVKNAAGTIVSQSTVSYDESAYPLLTYGSVTGWTTSPSSYRGNVTTASRWLDYPTSTWISTHAQYDQCGSPRYSWDPKGNLSQVEYSSTYAYAYPTQATSAVPDPSGTYGQTLSLVSTSIYNFGTGLVTSTTDANGKTATFEYNDPLNRTTKVNRPDGGWTITNYTDTVGNTYIQTQTLRQTSPTQETLDAYQYFDKAGRSVRSFAKEGSTYLTSDTQYDNLGRVARVSNPYRTTALTDPVNPSGNWTTNGYDSLSRVITVTTPDVAQTTTQYSAVTTGSYIGTSVLASDSAPSPKKRQSVSDAQGRMIQVIEDPTNPDPNLAYQTNYTYDVLNNLRKVEQGSQLRYYGYDSLSRVIRTLNVEQTVNAALNWTDPVTGYNGGWTMGMSYDNNGSR